MSNDHDTHRTQDQATQAAERMLPLVPLGIGIALASFAATVAAGNAPSLQLPWVPSLGVQLSFQLDGLSLLFGLLICGIGALVLVYAPAYFGDHPDRHRLYAWLILFMGAMLGVVLADNLITLFVFWELTSVSSYMLIGFKHESQKSREAALQALLVTGIGGLALLAGILLLGHAGGSYELSELITKRQALQNHPWLIPTIVLILLGAFTKSAQFPFHFWLPNAMAAPTPVSAFLHSATMVKAGVYLVARLSPIFSGVPIWDDSSVVDGSLTALTGGLLALQQTDLKRILAFSTVSALGMLMLLLGLGTPTAVQAAMVFLIGHACYKGALFLVAGTIDHCAATRDVRKLSGLARMMPLAAVAAALAGLSQAGIPPAGGFLAKELIYESALKLTTWVVPVLVLVFFANTSFVAVTALVAVRPFFGQPSQASASAHRAHWRLTMPPLLLGIAGLAIGLWPQTAGLFLVAPAVAAAGHAGDDVYLKLWHGFNLPLLLSIATLATGYVAFARWPKLRAQQLRLRWLYHWGPETGYATALQGLRSTATWQTKMLQNGSLPVYLSVVLLAFTALVGWELVDHIDIPQSGPWLEVRPYEVCIPLLIIAAAAMAVSTDSRLAAVCALGVIGFSVAMLFVMFGAPDLAMTQLAIETLTVILFVFVIYRLPRFTIFSNRIARLRDAALAVAAGGVMTAVVLAATFAHTPSRVTPFFIEHSLESAKGRNMVNVILVDFRALDTLGEIVVLAIAALGILALLRLRIDASDSEESGERRQAEQYERSPRASRSLP